MKFLLALLLSIFSLLAAANVEPAKTDFPLVLNGYIISTLSPSEKIVGKTTLHADGLFHYVGNNNVKLSGRIQSIDPNGNLVATGITELPSFLFLQARYPDGSTKTQLNLKGKFDGVTLKGTYSSMFEQGLFFFALAGHENVLQPADQFTLPTPDDLAYTHAAKPGPAVIVLPGKFSSDPDFATEVSAETMVQAAEAELQRAGFGVVESGKFSSALPSLVKAYATGALDPHTRDLLTIGPLAQVKWVVFIEMDTAKKLNHPSPQPEPVAKRKAPKSNLGKFAAIMGVLAELGDKREVELWGLRAKYKILDRNTASVAHEGAVEDILLTAQTISRDLVMTAKQQKDVSYHAMMRRIVQLAVEEISKRLK